VDIPEPQPGLVFRYAYLWREEQKRGADEGRKDRPCAIVLAVAQADGSPRVVVAAITHSPPRTADEAVAIPRLTAKRLGLDDEPKWIVTSEFNVFSWPGPDIRPAPGRQPASIAYGQLPHALTTQVLNQARAHIRSRTAVTVERDEPGKA
jgi:hypothetical protein